MEGARNLALWLAPKVLLTERLAARRASLIVSCSPPARWRRGLPVVQLPLGGLDDEELALLRRVPPRTDRPFRMASIGRLLGWKGFDPALRAFARLRAESPESEYWIVGDGMERGHLERLARELGVHHAVRFLGWLPREEMFTVLAETDVLVHPSLHEQFGYVVLEAMAAGRPVVCVDPGGPALIVPDGLGLKVAAQTRGQLVSDLHAALVRLARNEALRVSLGRELRAHVEQHWTWEQVGARLLELYDRVATGALADPAAEKDAVPVERAVSAGKG